MSFIINSLQSILNHGVTHTPTKTFQDVRIKELEEEGLEEIEKLRIELLDIDLFGTGDRKSSNLKWEIEKKMRNCAFDIGRKALYLEPSPELVFKLLDRVSDITKNNPVVKNNIKSSAGPVDQNRGLHQVSSLNNPAKGKQKWLESISKILLISYLFFTSTVYNIIKYVTTISVYKAKPSLGKAECGV